MKPIIIFVIKWVKIPNVFKSKPSSIVKPALKNVFTINRVLLSSTCNTQKISILEKILAQKSFEKQRRKNIYNDKISRRIRLYLRRDNTKKNGLKDKFRMWFDSLTQRQFYLDRSARRSGLIWKIKISTIIERTPIITETTPQWEQDYLNLRAHLEKNGKVFPSELVTFNHVDTSFFTMEEAIKQLPPGLVTSKGISMDDSSSLKTLGRKLDASLYFTILPNMHTGWILPTVEMKTNDRETMLEAAKRAASSTVGTDVKLRYLSNSPLGIDVIPYDSERQLKENVFGEKVFYMRVQYVSGCTQEDKLEKKFDDWAWLDRSEITARIKSVKDEKTNLFYHYLL